VEFITLMWFERLESVKGFMGDDYELAHVPVEAQAVLEDFDRRSVHYEVLERRDQPRWDRPRPFGHSPRPSFCKYGHSLG
jgi:hypothetical protein